MSILVKVFRFTVLAVWLTLRLIDWLLGAIVLMLCWLLAPWAVAAIHAGGLGRTRNSPTQRR
jgi:hypothetical protein